MTSLKMPQERFDKESLDEAELHILSRLGNRIHNLLVSCKDEGLVLQGRVRSYYVKQLAQQAVLELGLPIDRNEIEVA